MQHFFVLPPRHATAAVSGCRSSGFLTRYLCIARTNILGFFIAHIRSTHHCCAGLKMYVGVCTITPHRLVRAPDPASSPLFVARNSLRRPLEEALSSLVKSKMCVETSGHLPQSVASDLKGVLTPPYEWPPKSSW